jgi:elongation factor 1 alpha-like protein
MSKHRIKNVSVDDDLYDDFDDDEGQADETETLTAEDKEQLRLGTLKVREALTGVSVSDGEIQEALWHYYYDVAKSVTYLKSQDQKPETR